MIAKSEMTHDATMAERLETARQQAGITKWSLAVKSGLSLSSVRMAFQGVASTRTLTLICRVLGVSLDDIRGRKEVRP